MVLFVGPRSLRLFISYYFYFLNFFILLFFLFFLLFKYFVNSVLFYIPAPSPPFCMQCEVLALALLSLRHKNLIYMCSMTHGIYSLMTLNYLIWQRRRFIAQQGSCYIWGTEQFSLNFDDLHLWLISWTFAWLWTYCSTVLVMKFTFARSFDGFLVHDHEDLELVLDWIGQKRNTVEQGRLKRVRVYSKLFVLTLAKFYYLRGYILIRIWSVHCRPGNQHPRELFNPSVLYSNSLIVLKIQDNCGKGSLSRTM